MRSRRRFDPLQGFNAWSGISDMMLAAFSFVLLLWMAERVQAMRLPLQLSDLRRVLAETQSQVEQERAARTEAQRLLAEIRAAQGNTATLSERLAVLLAENESLRREISKLTRTDVTAATLARENESLRREVARLNDKPPIINMPEAEGFRFNSGSAELTPEFDLKLRDQVIPELARLCARYGNRIDTIEVIGHTDGQAVSGGRSSNLDALLEAVATNREPINKLRFGSNADLGLIRAVAVSQRLRSAQGGSIPPGLSLRSYSAAQLVPPDGTELVVLPEFLRNDTGRRRIEIRLTRRKAATPASETGGR